MNFMKNLKTFIWGDQDNKNVPEVSTSSEPAPGSKRQTRRGRTTGREASTTIGNSAQGIVPILQDADLGNGGVQSLHWYAIRQRQDEDGSMADAFFVETGSKMTKKTVRNRPRPSSVEVLMVDAGNVILAQ